MSDFSTPFILPAPNQKLVFFPPFQPSTEDLGLGGIGGNPEAVPFAIAVPTVRIVYWFTGQDNEPAGSLFGNPDEDQLLVRGIGIYPQIGRYLQPWSFDSGATGLYGLPDENDRWVNPNQPIVQVFNYPQQFGFEQHEVFFPLPGDDDQFAPRIIYPAGGRWLQPWFDAGAAGLYGLPDEFEVWRNPFYSLVRTFSYPQPWIGEQFEIIPPVAGDDDQQNLTIVRPPLGRYVQPFSFDQSAAGLYGLPDDDLTRSGLLTLANANRYVQPFGFDLGSANLFVPIVDEDVWQNPLVRVAYALAPTQQWPFDDSGLGLPIVDEMYWSTNWPHGVVPSPMTLIRLDPGSMDMSDQTFVFRPKIYVTRMTDVIDLTKLPETNQGGNV